MAVVFPLVLLLLHFWKAEEKPVPAFLATLSSKVWLPLWPFLVTSLLFGWIAVNIQAGGDFYGLIERGTQSVAIAEMNTFSLVERFQFAGYGFMQYLINFFWPSNLSPYYPYPDMEAFSSSIYYKLAPLLMVAVLILALLSLKKTKALAMGIGFYFFTIVLVLQFISVGAVVMADRYSYLPYIGLGMAVAFLVQQAVPKEKQAWAFGGLIGWSLLLPVKTIPQIEVWQDSETLWTTAIEQQTKDGQPILGNMVQPLSIRGSYYGKIAQASRDPQKQQEYLDKAFQDFQKAAAFGSTNVLVYKGLGNSYGMQGNNKQDQARRLQQQGKTAEAQALQQQSYEDFQKAIENYNQVMLLKPEESAEAYFNRGITYSILRDHPKAIADYTTFIQYNPPQVLTAYLNRGISYFELRQYAAAKSDFETVLRYNPQNKLAQQYLNQLARQ